MSNTPEGPGSMPSAALKQTNKNKQKQTKNPNKQTNKKTQNQNHISKGLHILSS